MMRFLPSQKYQFESSLSIEDVQTRFRENIEAYSAILSPFIKHKPFVGKMNNNSFTISRLVWHRNSMLSIIKGEILPNQNSSKVLIEIKLSPIGLIFWYFQLVWSTAVFLLSSFTIITQPFTPQILLSIPVWIIGYCLCIIPFRIETKKVIQLIDKILK